MVPECGRMDSLFNELNLTSSAQYILFLDFTEEETFFENPSRGAVGDVSTAGFCKPSCAILDI